MGFSALGDPGAIELYCFSSHSYRVNSKTRDLLREGAAEKLKASSPFLFQNIYIY